MNVLLLSPYPERIASIVSATGDAPRTTMDRLELGALRQSMPDFIVSYGYRRLIGREILEAMPGRLVNLHISALPWNRGADPNFWSFFDGSPKGVSIHRIDEGLDTGPLIARREIAFAEGETLATTYWALRATLEELFAEMWPRIRTGAIDATAQRSAGSYHPKGAMDRYWDALPAGWDTPVAIVEELGERYREAS